MTSVEMAGPGWANELWDPRTGRTAGCSSRKLQGHHINVPWGQRPAEIIAAINQRFGPGRWKRCEFLGWPLRPMSACHYLGDSLHLSEPWSAHLENHRAAPALCAARDALGPRSSEEGAKRPLHSPAFGRLCCGVAGAVHGSLGFINLRFLVQTELSG